MFNSDRPITNINDDKFDRAEFSKDLAKALINLANTDSFCVGLLGEWGSGKTSIINMTLDYIINELNNQCDESETCDESKKDKHNKKCKWFNKNKEPTESQIDTPIIFNFNPWYFQDENQLFNQFFLELVTLLRGNINEYIQMIADLIDEYGGLIELAKFIPKYGKKIEIIGQSTLNGLSKQLKGTNFSDKSIIQQKKKIEEKLSELKTKIIIVIDDIDRLTNEQIRCVFQLIKSVCDFPNTIYLVAFDRNIVVNALAQIQDSDGESYLEKVIQVPLTIPPIPESTINIILNERLYSIADSYSSLKNWSTINQNILYSCIYRIIKTQRSINRLCNLLEIKLASISDEINFTDLVLITALELEEPKIFDWIKNNKELLTGRKSNFNSFGEYSINTNSSEEERQKLIEIELEYLVKSINHKDSFSDDNLIDTLFITFPFFYAYYTFQPKPQLFLKQYENSIAHPSRFDRYFTLSFGSNYINKKKRDDLIKTADKDELLKVLRLMDEYDFEDSSLKDFVYEIVLFYHNIETDRKLLFAEALLDLGNNASIYAPSAIVSDAHLYADLIMSRIDHDELVTFILKYIDNMNQNTVNSIVYLVDALEINHNRIIHNGDEDKHVLFDNLINDSDLDTIEQCFVKQARDFIRDDILKDCFLKHQLHKFLNLLYLLDNPNTVYQLSVFFNDYLNVIRFIDYYIIHENDYYRMFYDFLQFISEKDVEKAINSYLENLNEKDNDELLVTAAVYSVFNQFGNNNEIETIKQTDVDNWISKQLNNKSNS